MMNKLGMFGVLLLVGQGLTAHSAERSASGARAAASRSVQAPATPRSAPLSKRWEISLAPGAHPFGTLGPADELRAWMSAHVPNAKLVLATKLWVENRSGALIGNVAYVSASEGDAELIRQHKPVMRIVQEPSVGRM